MKHGAVLVLGIALIAVVLLAGSKKQPAWTVGQDIGFGILIARIEQSGDDWLYYISPPEDPNTEYGPYTEAFLRELIASWGVT